jgi:site-specific recombinase XerD
VPRKPSPWWWEARQRWAVQIAGVRHVEPDGIAQDDLTGMAAWWESLKESVSSKADKVEGITIGQLAKAYLDWDEKRVGADLRDSNSHYKVRSRLKQICLESIQGVKIGRWRALRFGHKQYDELVMTWRAKHSQGYTRALASTLKTIFNWGAKDISGPLLRRNRIAEAPKPPEPIVEDRFAEPEEAKAWLDWLNDRKIHPDYVLLQEVLIYTGARPSEWTRAVVRELDTREWMLIRDKWKAVKAKKRARRVFVLTRIREKLLKHIEGLSPDAPIFLTPRGKPWNQSRLSAATRIYRSRAIADGVKLRDIGPERLTCYRWRHTAITNLLMEGVPIQTVADLMGMSATQISKTYAHLLKGHLADAAEILGRK